MLKEKSKNILLDDLLKFLNRKVYVLQDLIEKFTFEYLEEEALVYKNLEDVLHVLVEEALKSEIVLNELKENYKDIKWPSYHIFLEDLVNLIGKEVNRLSNKLSKSIIKRIIYRVINYIISIIEVLNQGSFSVFSTKVLNHLKNFDKEKDSLMREKVKIIDQLFEFDRDKLLILFLDLALTGFWNKYRKAAFLGDL